MEVMDDFTALELREDHENRPIWVTPGGKVFLETFSVYYNQAYDFLIAISEPVTRPQYIHEYRITPYSLFAAASVGLGTEEIIDGLKRLSKNELDNNLIDFIADNTERCGKLKLLLDKGRYFVESKDHKVLSIVLENMSIRASRIDHANVLSFAQRDRETGFMKTIIKKEKLEIPGIVFDQQKAMGIDVDKAQQEKQEHQEEVVYSFEIDPTKVELVRKECSELGYPTLEEYEFRKDMQAGDLPISLNATANVRPYQEKSLSKMFGNGRARSGIIVLPCGAGKTLVGITATCTIRKNTLVFCNTGVSVKQWKSQYMKWANIPEENICLFTSTEKQPVKTETVLLITTYNMIAFGGKRSQAARKILQEIKEREWGLIILDEVHVAPARTFRTCVSKTKSRCKLGLTATLVREDDKVEDLFFLIGPKLYEANWLSLQKAGYLATVKCIEVRCPMTPEFYREYLKVEPRKKQLLYVMNPYKFRACQYLIEYHEKRGDKILVFSDIIFALEKYATLLKRSFLYGKTSDHERLDLLSHLQSDDNFNTLFISKVGDTSIDLPDVNVIIQISSHFASRRQEAQRLGRILRPKSQASESFNAFFYTLISDDTKEVTYATKRQSFLVDQGYSFEAVMYKDIIDENDPPPGLMFGMRDEQMQLLAQCKALDSHFGDIEEDDEDEKDHMRERYKTKQAAKARRRRGDASTLSGGTGRLYEEFSRKQVRQRPKSIIDQQRRAQQKKRKYMESLKRQAEELQREE